MSPLTVGLGQSRDEQGEHPGLSVAVGPARAPAGADGRRDRQQDRGEDEQRGYDALLSPGR